MKQVVVMRIAEPAEGFEVIDVPIPRPGPGQVLVAVKARPIQPADLLIVRGRHLVQPQLPDPVGIEGAGIVVGHGEGVTHPPLGTAVALPFGGTWAEYVVLPAEAPIPLPPGCDLQQAALLALNPVTAWGLVAGLQPGQWLVQNAANSTVGQLVTRMAAARGIRSISVVRRPGMAPALTALGADHVLIDGDDLARQVRALTQGRGADRALDAVAGRATGRLHEATAEGGEVVCYGLLAGDEITLPAAQTIFRDVTVRGYSRLRRLRAMAPDERQRMEAEILADFAAGRFATPILATYPLEQVAAAVRHAEAAGAEGKVLLVSPEPPEAAEPRRP